MHWQNIEKKWYKQFRNGACLLTETRTPCTLTQDNISSVRFAIGKDHNLTVLGTDLVL